MSSFWWNFHHWLHWKLSKWQLPVQPVMKISSKWRHFRFSVGAHGNALCRWNLLNVSLKWRHKWNGAMASQITSLTFVYSTVYSGEIKENIKAPVTGEFPAQMTSNAENASIWWRHHGNGTKYGQIKARNSLNNWTLQRTVAKIRTWHCYKIHLRNLPGSVSQFTVDGTLSFQQRNKIVLTASVFVKLEELHIATARKPLIHQNQPVACYQHRNQPCMS